MIDTSVFEHEPDWPILRGGALTKGSLRRLQQLPGIVMFCKGVHFRGQREYPSVNLGLIRHVRCNGTAQRKLLRRLCEVW